MNKAYLGLGSNVGDSVSLLRKTIEYIDSSIDFKITGSSSFYETSPYGNVEQNNFINCVIEIETKFDYKDLFAFTKNAEKDLGRKHREHWGPREVDIDILLFNDDVIKTGELVIPHEDLTNRDFVLVPLLEINSELTNPESKKRLSDYLDTNLENHILNKLN